MKMSCLGMKKLKKTTTKKILHFHLHENKGKFP